MITDCHVHFYDPFRPGGVPWPEPENRLLYRTVLPEHYKAVALPHGIDGIVVVEASEWVEDNQWVLDLAEHEPLIVGLVGNLDPYAEEFGAHLTRFAANGLFRGIRLRELRTGPDDPSSLFYRNMKMLSEHDLELDLAALYDEEFPSFLAVVERVPDLRVVINHMGGPGHFDGRAASPAWVEKVRKAGEYPQIFCKVSAVMQSSAETPAAAEVDFYSPVLDTLWDAFGDDRLIYASNWPNMEGAGTFEQGIRLVRSYFESKGQEALEKFFWRNSQQAYKWSDRA